MSSKEVSEGGGPEGDAQTAGDAQKAWADAMAAMAKNATAMAQAGAPFMPGGFPPMTFPPAAFMPGMVPGMMNPYASLAAFYQAPAGADGGEGDAKSNRPSSVGNSVSDDGDDDYDDEDAPPVEEDVKEPPPSKRRPSRAASAGQKKARSGSSGLGVKSKSQAALALLATTAGASAVPGEPWTAATTMAGHQLLQAASADLDEAALVGMDDREVKRQRRKQSNRESARRSRLRKQAECETLQLENRGLKAEVTKLREEKMELSSQLAILNAKLSAFSAFAAMQGAALPPELAKVAAAAATDKKASSEKE